MSDNDPKTHRWQDCGGALFRRDVPGGWLYSDTTCDPHSLVFVPFPSSADAVARERSRCAKIVADRIDGGTDTKNHPHVSDVGLTQIIAEIEGGGA